MTRNERMLRGMKWELAIVLVDADPDFAFEVAVRGLDEVLLAYTYNQLKLRLNATHPSYPY
jgi:cytochrome c oxidase assembly protein Cox11